MPERNCGACKNQERWGCHGRRWRYPDKDKGELDSPENWIKPAEMAVEIDGEETFACPRQPLRQSPGYYGRVLLFYGMYKKGHLPDRGSVVDQSNSLLETLRIIDEANDDADAIIRQREEAKRRRGQNSGRRR
jgi:hypothetical protein